MENGKKIIFLDEKVEGGAENVKVDGEEEQFSENTQFKGGEYEATETELNELEGGNRDVEKELISNADDSRSVSSNESDLISEGGRSSISSGSSMSSVRTSDLLSVDPMYIRLTKFLETDIKLEGGGEKRVNVTELLYDVSNSLKEINITFKEMSTVLQKMAVNKAAE